MQKNTNLHIDLAAKKLNFNLRESVNLSLTITNNGGDPVLLNPFMEPESYWLRFEVTNQKNKRMGWLGPDVKIIETDNRVTLEEGYYWGRSYIGFEKLYDLLRITADAWWDSHVDKVVYWLLTTEFSEFLNEKAMAKA